jgi:cytochrome c556
MVMRRLLRAAVMGIAFAVAMACPAMAERRVALVIGNSEYQAVAKLNNPQHDAQALSTALRNLGFDQVTMKTELGRDQLVSALRDFAREADKADWAVVYYSGHGIEVGGINYMIPVDARLVTDRDIEFEAVNMNLVLTAVDSASKLRLVILDACRDNPFITQMRRGVGSRSIGRGLGQIEPDAAILVAYSAKHGQMALDGDGANSPFVTSLLARLQTPNLEIRRMFDLVRDDVLQTTRRQQQPFTYGSLPGNEDFYFVRTAAAVGPVPNPMPAPPPAVNVPGPTPVITPPDPRDLARLVQTELARVGCELGGPDGVWGPASQRAMQLFNSTTGSRFDTNGPSVEALSDLRSRSTRACPITCRQGFKLEGNACVAIVCQPGESLTSTGNCVDSPYQGSAVRARQENRKQAAAAMRGIKGIIDMKGSTGEALAYAANLKALGLEFVRMFPVGSNQGDTKVLPAVWTQWRDFEAANRAQIAAYDRLAAAASSGDLAALTMAFGNAGKSCGACHDQFRRKAY